MAATILTLAAAALAASAAPMPGTMRTVAMKTGTGQPAGTVMLTGAPGGVLLKADLTGLPPGWHAIHIHERGDCSDTAFKSAGAHTHAATPTVHGLLNPHAEDTGDLPNIWVAADGTAHAELFTMLTSLPDMLDADGSALIVHARPDDHISQPIGGAGDRIACGVVR